MNDTQRTAPGRTSEIPGLLQRAYASFQSAAYGDAERLCEEVLTKASTNPTALLMMGMIHIHQNRLDAARSRLRDASRVALANPRYLFQLANGLGQVGLHGDAASCWETLCRLEPGNEEAHTNLGAALCMDSRLQEAAIAFEKATEIAPACVPAHTNLGITYRKLGRTKRAENSLRTVLEIQPRHEMASAQLGGLLQLEGRVEEAVDVLNEALIDAPDSADLLYGLYGASFEAEGMDRSIDVLDRAVRSTPDHFLARSALGMLLDRAGRREDAERHFDHVRKNSPDYDFIVDSWFYARGHFGPRTRLFTLSNSGLAYAVENVEIDGLFLEFGVWQGRSINFISSCTESTVHGFDSFEGIPEAWEGMPEGSYSTFGELPRVNDNVVLHRGWFDESLPDFLESNRGPVAFMNIDCDTYGSTRAIFDSLGQAVTRGTVIVFDEYFCFPNWREHEYKAFQEYLQESGHAYEYLFFNLHTRQAGILITR